VKHIHLVWLRLVTLICPAVVSAVDPLIGRPAPEWQLTNWLNSSPLALKDLRGQVVLVRWWTAPQCEFCRVTAPALNEFHADFAAKGLRVIGIYHHKLPTPLEPSHVAGQAAELGFKFPVAVDPGWRTLRRWWLDGHERDFTSVSFLLDRRGVIRHLHVGETHAGTARARRIEGQLKALLDE